MNTSLNKKIYYFSWAAIAVFYFYLYVLRVEPGIMMVELRRDFKLSAEDISSLGSIYLYAYSLVQLPLGYILDRVGVRRVLLSSLGVCLAGCALFSLATSLWALQMGRFFIGLGSAPVFICALKYVCDHFPQKLQGLFMGITLAVGTIGALISGKFLTLSLDAHGWRGTMEISTAMGGLVFILLLALLPRFKASEKTIPQTYLHLWKGLSAIFQRKEILIYATLAISVYTPLCVLADLWGTTFLMEKYALSRAQAAQMNLYMYGGLTLGSIILPWMSSKWGGVRRTIFSCATGITLCVFILLSAKTLAMWQLSFLLITIGLLCGAEMICFAGAAQSAPASFSGLTLGVVNTLNMLGGALLLKIMGWYLDTHWSGAYGQDGARHYSQEELSAALMILIFVMITCSLLVFFLPKAAGKGKQETSSAKECLAS